MALKKSDLYRSIWQSCDELRGGMDASQYKDYVLVLLFMKYVSDKYASKRDALIEVPHGGSFEDMVKLKGDKEIGDKINKIIGRLAKANEELKGVIDVADFNDEDKLGRGKEMVDRLSKLVGIFESVDLRANRAEGDDLLGDAYEYLMRHFATESGKSKGQFYTPAEVSRVMAKVVGIGAKTRQDQTIYDPTCGSGSLLLKAADESPRGITIYGQENDVATWALAKMNLILHGHPTAELWRGNTLSAPYFKNGDGSLQRFDFAVANPPFSMKAWSNGLDPLHDEFQRFELGIPPAKNGDYAFLQHFIASLKSKGKGAIILPHGVLFRGNKEAHIRRSLVSRGLLKGIIGLPANLFYGTSIPACLLILDKENAEVRRGIFMLDASRDFIKEGNKNRLRSRDIHRIVDVFNKQSEVPGYSRMVPTSEIGSPANDYNLNIPRYIESTQRVDLHDLDAHLRGGIPQLDVKALGSYWTAFPALRTKLFKAGDRRGYSLLRAEPEAVETIVRKDKGFKGLFTAVFEMLEAWQSTHERPLNSLKEGARPKEIIEVISEDLLQRCEFPLLNKYRVYQRLMDYWAETMQDDVYLVAADGWTGAARPRATVEDKERKIKETPDLVIGKKKYKMDLVPPRLIAQRFFSDDVEAIVDLELEAEDASRELTDFVEDNSSEDGPLEDAKNDKGEVTKGGLRETIKVYKDLADSDGEREVLARCLELFDAAKAADTRVKEEHRTLDTKVLASYENLTEDEIKSLVVRDKWYSSIRSSLEEEVDLIAERLADRINRLVVRYEQPLPMLEKDAATLSRRVRKHLKKMGLTW